MRRIMVAVTAALLLASLATSTVLATGRPALQICNPFEKAIQTPVGTVCIPGR